MAVRRTGLRKDGTLVEGADARARPCGVSAAGGLVGGRYCGDREVDQSRLQPPVARTLA
jgi:hypothetical protein